MSCRGDFGSIANGNLLSEFFFFFFLPPFSFLFFRFFLYPATELSKNIKSGIRYRSRAFQGTKRVKVPRSQHNKITKQIERTMPLRAISHRRGPAFDAIDHSLRYNRAIFRIYLSIVGKKSKTIFDF